MSAGSNVKVIGSGWFRHNSFGSVTCIAVAPGWLVMYLHFEGFHAIPNAYMIVAAASILDLRPCLDAASKSPSSTTSNRQKTSNRGSKPVSLKTTTTNVS